jgi:hypothetical protein
LTTTSSGNNQESRVRRRIDFVLVYSLEVRDPVSYALNEQRRRAFQRKLQAVGFEIEEQDIVGGSVSVLIAEDDFLSVVMRVQESEQVVSDNHTDEQPNRSSLFRRRPRQRRQSKQLQQQSAKRFVRLHAPFELLLELAEKTRMKLPIEVSCRTNKRKRSVSSIDTSAIRVHLSVGKSRFDANIQRGVCDKLNI